MLELCALTVKMNQSVHHHRTAPQRNTLQTRMYKYCSMYYSHQRVCRWAAAGREQAAPLQAAGMLRSRDQEKTHSTQTCRETLDVAKREDDPASWQTSLKVVLRGKGPPSRDAAGGGVASVWTHSLMNPSFHSPTITPTWKKVHCPALTNGCALHLLLEDKGQQMGRGEEVCSGRRGGDCKQAS